MELVENKFGIRQGRKFVKLQSSVYCLQRVKKDDNALIKAFEELFRRHLTIGIWKCYYLLLGKCFKCKKNLPLCQDGTRYERKHSSFQDLSIAARCYIKKFRFQLYYLIYLIDIYP